MEMELFIYSGYTMSVLMYKETAIMTTGNGNGLESRPLLPLPPLPPQFFLYYTRHPEHSLSYVLMTTFLRLVPQYRQSISEGRCRRLRLEGPPVPSQAPIARDTIR